MVAEDFTPKALAVADYLNGNSGSDASYGIELWRYGLREDSDGDDKRPYFLLEQLLPPYDAREEIEKKREAAKTRKRSRDPERRDFIGKALEFLRNKGYVVDKHNRHYSFCFRASEWPEGLEAKLSFERAGEPGACRPPTDYDCQ